MITRIASGASAFVKRVFPERQIYHRAEGQVHYVSLSTRSQLVAATASAVIMGWTAYASASVFLGGHVMSARSAEAARVKAKYERWLAEARAREASALALLQTRTTDFEEEKREILSRHETLKGLLDHALGEADAPAGEAVLMNAAVEDPTPRTSRLAREARVETDPRFVQFASMVDEQESMLTQAETAAQDRVEDLRAVLRLTGLSPQKVIEEGERARGGPYVGLSEEDAFGAALDLEDGFAKRVARVAARVVEAEKLERAIDAAPLGMPTNATEYRRASGFGKRTDPFNGRPAFHHGLDFSSYRMAPITAAAPGKVTFAGWKGGYGKVVEIDHGHGFKTRYAHLHQHSVKRGDEVAFGQKIGGMGSTGRSTGTHVHYEVWFKGKVYDPDKFLKAGRYVQQG